MIKGEIFQKSPPLRMVAARPTLYTPHKEQPMSQDSGDQTLPPDTPHLRPARFAGRLAAPSFVLPAGVAENARFLAGKVDEVGLCFFETQSCLN